MDIEEFKSKIEKVKLGESKGLLKSIFGTRVSDSMPETYTKLKVKMLKLNCSVGDLVFLRLYSKGQPQMQVSVGVVISTGENTFKYLSHKKGKTVEYTGDYNFVKRDGFCTTGFYGMIKEQIKK